MAGLAFLNGKVYLERYQPNQILVWDPVEHAAVTTLDLGGNAGAGLTGADDLGVLFEVDLFGSILRLDPATGQVTEFPFPHAENTLREFFTDAKGRFWYGSPANDRVGYFYMAK